MWDLIVSVPDHCLSFYFTRETNAFQFFICQMTSPNVFTNVATLYLSDVYRFL